MARLGLVVVGGLRIGSAWRPLAKSEPFDSDSIAHEYATTPTATEFASVGAWITGVARRAFQNTVACTNDSQRPNNGSHLGGRRCSGFTAPTLGRGMATDAPLREPTVTPSVPVSVMRSSGAEELRRWLKQEAVEDVALR